MLRRGTMPIHVANGSRIKSSVGKSHLHDHAHGFLFRAGHVGAIGVGGEADNLGMDLCTACTGVLQLFEHKHASTFTDHQSFAIPIVGPWRRLRLGVASAGCIKQVKGQGLAGTQLVGTAAEHQGLLSVTDCLVGETHALAARGTGTGC